MSVILAEKSSTVPLDLTIEQEGVGGLTGKSPVVGIRNTVTGFYLDFADSTFKNSGWTTKYETMTDIERGHYQRSLALASLLPALVAGDILAAEYHIDDGGSVKGDDADLIFLTELQTQVTLLRKYATNKMVEISGNPGHLVLYDDDGATPLKNHSLFDQGGGAVLPTVGSPAIRGADT